MHSIINTLVKARNEVADRIANPMGKEPQLPWRVYENPHSNDEMRHMQDVLNELDGQIIDLEQKLYRDPVQDAEMRAEMYAEMAITGVRDDPSLYMHTPHEERLFQEGIQNQLRYGYYDEDGYWEDGWDTGDYGPVDCSTCGARTDVDEVIFVNGHDCCQHCGPEAIDYMYFLGFLTNTKIDSGRWETEFSFVTEEDDE